MKSKMFVEAFMAHNSDMWVFRGMIEIDGKIWATDYTMSNREIYSFRAGAKDVGVFVRGQLIEKFKEEGFLVF